MSDVKKSRGCFFYGCVFSLGLGALFVAVVAGVFYYGASALTPSVDKFVTQVDSGDYAGAYANLADGWKQISTPQQFTEFETTIKDKLGACKSKTMTSVSVNTLNGVTTAKLVYSATFTKGPATMTFSLIKQGGDWKVEGVTYDSELLKDATPAPAAEKPEK